MDTHEDTKVFYWYLKAIYFPFLVDLKESLMIFNYRSFYLNTQVLLPKMLYHKDIDLNIQIWKNPLISNYAYLETKQEQRSDAYFSTIKSNSDGLLFYPVTV